MSSGDFYLLPGLGRVALAFRRQIYRSAREQKEMGEGDLIHSRMNNNNCGARVFAGNSFVRRAAVACRVSASVEISIDRRPERSER